MIDFLNMKHGSNDPWYWARTIWNELYTEMQTHFPFGSQKGQWNYFNDLLVDFKIIGELITDARKEGKEFAFKWECFSHSSSTNIFQNNDWCWTGGFLWNIYSEDNIIYFVRIATEKGLLR